MKLIVLSNHEKFEPNDDIVTQMLSGTPDDNETDIVTKMFENGLPTLHLRKSGFSKTEAITYLEKIPSIYHNRIILHSNHSLALRYGVKGIHLSKSDKRNNFKTWLKLKWLKFKNPDLLVTTSYSRASTLFEEEKVSYNYIFLSPIFDSLTGKFVSGTQENTLKSVMQRTSHNVIARGGVSVEKIEQIKEIGFAGMAIYSTIWKKQDPLQEFIRFKERFEELGIPIE